MTCLLTQNRFECRVSSVLNRDNRSYGKKHMFDNCLESCWNSDAGTPQWVVINFDQTCEVNSFEIQFQGGFVDNNTIQKFELKEPIRAKTFKLVFNESTDFFGRIIIYKLSLYS
ncbi:nuclear receptor 2C2-associated protein isoform X3 [Calliopsis andreniformis]|uniref:nuclear receptor 2C2-associated protein isoform X3 n=1 Tax=Calliopsis andreniformis TaxID=337506 RepID=UPI003FCE68C4